MIIVATVENAGGACPYQVFGRTTDNRPVYARYRHGHLRIEVGAIAATSTRWQDDTVFSIDYGDGFDGCLSYEELKTITEGKFEWPELTKGQRDSWGELNESFRR